MVKMMYDDTAASRMAYSHQPYHLPLQQQQLWDWKMEPSSPASQPQQLDVDNCWYTQDGGDYVLAAHSSISDLIVPDTAEGEGDAKPPTRAEAAQKLLNDLDEWIKEEPFSDWYEEKIDLPIFEELETVQPPVITRRDVPSMLCASALMARQVPAPSCDVINAKMQPACDVINAKMQPACDVINAKMQPACDVIKGNGTMQQTQTQALKMTPHMPQLPILAPVNHHPSLMQEFDFVLDNEDTLTPPESPRENHSIGLQEMPTEELDELVRIRVESLVEGPDSSRCSSTSYQEESSEEASSPASMDSGYEDPDPEWSPDHSDADADVKQSRKRRQGKPYSRPPPEEKRQRKKEQNKNAATRYRLKKKAEIEEILGEERELLDKNQQLKTDVGELAREIKYLKSLMREVFKAKGLIK